MKTISYALLAFFFCIAPFNASASLQGIGRITLVQGDVQMRMSGTEDWVPAAENTPLEEGDSLWTPTGARIEIQLQDGTYIRLDSRSSLDVLALNDQILQFHLGMGHAYIRTGAIQKWPCQFDLTESTVSITSKARLRLDIAAEGDEDISVLKGAAYVEGYGTRTRVHRGEMMSVEGSRSEILPLNPPDAWEQWNLQRDELLGGQSNTTGYLPDELSVYDDELARSGEWFEDAEYGFVWQPTLIIGTAWSPYRMGRWIWRDGDYVWISHEHWGWAPYHYGRWAMFHHRGWCWVPPKRGDVYWAPAYVGWVTASRRIGWVPLAPGETYYGRGYHGHNSVSLSNVARIPDKNSKSFTYRNWSADHNALIVLQKDAFSKGKMKAMRPQGDIMTEKGVSINRPDLPATKALRMPLPKSIAHEHLPPPKVADTTIIELRHRLPQLDNRVSRPVAPQTKPEGKTLSSPDQRRPQAPQSGSTATRPEAVPPQNLPKREIPVTPAAKAPLPTSQPSERRIPAEITRQPAAPQPGPEIKPPVPSTAPRQENTLSPIKPAQPKRPEYPDIRQPEGAVIKQPPAVNKAPSTPVSIPAMQHPERRIPAEITRQPAAPQPGPEIKPPVPSTAPRQENTLSPIKPAQPKRPEYPDIRQPEGAVIKQPPAVNKTPSAPGPHSAAPQTSMPKSDRENTGAAVEKREPRDVWTVRPKEEESKPRENLRPERLDQPKQQREIKERRPGN